MHSGSGREMWNTTGNRTTASPIVARVRVLLFFSLTTGAASVGAQSQSPTTRLPNPPTDTERQHGLSLWTGVSFDSRGPLGAVPGRKFFLAAIRYQRTMIRLGSVRLRYVGDIIPIAVVTNNPDAEAFAFASDTVLRVGPGARTSVYGFGASPLGFEISPFRTGTLEVVAGGTGGFLAFSRPVPFRNARRFNYTFEFSAAARFFVRSSLAITLGYRLHHMSNAGTGSINPGLDANVIYVELTPR